MLGMPDTRIVRLAIATALAAACGGPPPLALIPAPVPVGHDGYLVHDVVPLDLDRDGDADLVVATELGLRYLRADDGRWLDDTPGTALETVPPVTRVALDGSDLLCQRGAATVRLAWSGIGSWHEASALEATALPPAPTTVEADLNGDGAPDRASLAGRIVRVELRDAAGALHDVTSRVAADALSLREPGTTLHAADLDGDGDLDLLGAGGRLMVWRNNGGRLDPAAPLGASLAPEPVSVPRAIPPPSAPPPWFTDITSEAGVAFVHAEGGEQWDIRPTMGPGVAFADVDGDLDEDLYVVGGSDQLGRLFLNDGAGRFTDGTEAWGLHRGEGARGAGMGASFADVDGDGDPDLHVTRDGPDVLWRNDAGRFTDVSAASGLADPRWSAGAAWADIDRDGDLDLYVTHYLQFDTALIPPESEHPASRREDPIAMLPYVFPPQADALYLNDGGGRFRDISVESGIAAVEGKGLGVAFLDEDDDGLPDIYVANDTTPNFLWRNRGGWDEAAAGDAATPAVAGAGDADATPAGAGARDADGTAPCGRFEEVALFVGLDDPRGGMGVALADVDGDGDEDLFTSYWQTEPNALYRNNRVHKPTTRRFVPRFEDIAVAAGLGQPSVGVVGWGCALADLDNDGDADLAVANGYTSPDYETTMICVGQRSHLYENVTAPGSLSTQRDVPRWSLVPPERAGGHFGRELPGRGLAAADIDGDGDLDLAFTSNNGPLVLLRNERGGRSLRVVPEGDGRGVNRDAVGARVTLAFEDGGSAVATVRAGSSYLSGHERGVRFGLGARKAASLSVRWPDGTESVHAVPPDALSRRGGLRLQLPAR
jgi:enediyne biosynthesis protein E4